MSELTLVEIDKGNNEELQIALDILLSDYSNVPKKPTLESLKQSSNLYYFAKDKSNQIIGMTGFFYVTDSLVETVKTVVLSAYQGKGYGKLLSQMIEDHCVKLGAHKIRTTIYSHNTAMIQIKLKQGYVIEGFHPDHEAPGFDEYSLGKVMKGK